jgi:hypothetical protein
VSAPRRKAQGGAWAAYIRRRPPTHPPPWLAPHTPPSTNNNRAVFPSSGHSYWWSSPVKYFLGPLSLVHYVDLEKARRGKSGEGAPTI